MRKLILLLSAACGACGSGAQTPAPVSGSYAAVLGAGPARDTQATARKTAPAASATLAHCVIADPCVKEKTILDLSVKS
jgi:hypothetical protein